MICHTKRKTFSPPQPSEQPPSAARHKHFKTNDTRTAGIRSLSPVTHRQAEHNGPLAVQARPDPDTGSGQVAGPIVCGAPPPSPSTTVSEEISVENDADAETTLNSVGQLETNGDSSYVFPPG
ncbi:hypothetical protein OHC33_011175 [Knufia fluminis]|uniref:Uncharacterized protein n=1 Tax=Knufia fluminis TaxID=191047 RepID=A0AAN8EEK8_9EURO|nr:hypothetical protein OHC33_011175 [Knufia fluminis]